MVDKLGLGSETKELKLGSSFTNKGLAFHTFRYDFKPASVDTTKMATVDVLPNNEVTVTVPHCDGAGTAHTVFRGPKKPYTKECVLVIDHSTGEITLERLSQTLQLKKTRAVGSSKSARAMSPVPDHKKSSPLHSKTSPNPSSSPAAMSPVYRNPLVEQPPVRSSPKHSVAASSWANKQKSSHSPQTTQQQSRHLSSMPIINLDESEPLPAPPQQQQHLPSQDMNDMLGVISDSSSGSDSSSNSSDTDDSDAEADSRLVSMLSTNGVDSPPPVAPPRRETQAHGQGHQQLSMPSLLLSEDLQLSESGSDSD